MATLTRQVDRSTDDAGEVPVVPTVGDPILLDIVTRFGDTLECSHQVQRFINGLGRAGNPRKGTLPVGSLWVGSPLNTYIASVHGSESRTYDIDFNNCQMYCKVDHIRGFLTAPLDISAGPDLRDPPGPYTNNPQVFFNVDPEIGSFSPPPGVSWPAGCTTTGWPSLDSTTASTNIRVILSAPPGVNAYGKPRNPSACEMILLDIRNPGTGDFRIREREISMEPGENGGPRRTWPAGTVVEWVRDDFTAGLSIDGGHDINLWDYNYRGPSTISQANTPPYMASRRAFQHGLNISATQGLTYRGTLNISEVYGDLVYSGIRNASPSAPFPEQDANGRGFPATDIDIQCTGLLNGAGRQGIAPCHVNNWRIGAPEGSVTGLVEDMPDSALLVVKRSHRGHSAVDMEPEEAQWLARNARLYGMRFKGENARVHATAGNGVKDGLTLDSVHFEASPEITMGHPSAPESVICGPIIVVNCAGGAGRAEPGGGAKQWPSVIQAEDCTGVVVLNNRIPRLRRPVTDNLDNYGVTAVECSNFWVAGNDFGEANADAAIVVESREPDGLHNYLVGKINGDYPKPYGPDAGRPFGGDVYAPLMEPVGRNALPFGSGGAIAPNVDSGAPGRPFWTIPDDTSFRFSAGGANTGPQVYYTNQYTETRVNKDQVRCDHGGNAYRDRPPQQGNDQVGDFWGDPFPAGQIPLPPRPLTFGQFACIGGTDPDNASGCVTNPGDYWVVVVDSVTNRSYEYSNARWDGTVFHCNWGACYDLGGDGIHTVPGVGGGTASGMSQIFGLMRLWEISGNNWPDHPLVTPWQAIKQFPYFRYPARGSDGGANPDSGSNVFMGGRYFLGEDINLAGCSARDRKILYALKVYGFYFIDSGGADDTTFFASEWDSGNAAALAGPLEITNVAGTAPALKGGMRKLAHWTGGPWKPGTPGDPNPANRGTDGGER